MKHGRRHSKLKEQTYGRRFEQRAEGYARPYRPIDVAEPTGAPPPAPEPTTLAAALGKREKRLLRRLGIDPDEESSSES